MSLGKFLRQDDGNRYLVRGVGYGTFAPDHDGWQFPPADRIAHDFAKMAQCGINTVRSTRRHRVPLLDEASRNGLRVIAGLPWSQHVAFLDDRSLRRQIRTDVDREVRRVGMHDAVVMFVIGNEVPSSIVRWLGRHRVERFLSDLHRTAKSAAPHRLATYVNYPPTRLPRVAVSRPPGVQRVPPRRARAPGLPRPSTPRRRQPATPRGRGRCGRGPARRGGASWP